MVYNFQGVRQEYHCFLFLNIARWKFYLKDYKDSIVTALLQYGWPISFSADQLPRSSLRNHPSACRNPTQLHDYITQELQYGSVIGPFPHNPFSVDCVISPLQCVPKHDSCIPHVVHDLSFPPGQSINEGIMRNEYLGDPLSLRLPGIDRL